MGLGCFNVLTFGAKGDGTALDTAAIQAAIDACWLAGGGSVYFPKGTYLSGTLFLKSNVTINLEASATLLGSSDFNDYPQENVHGQRYDYHSNMERCFIYAENAENITITGMGKIDGNAGLFPKGPSDPRPGMFRFLRCRNIKLNNLRLYNPATWTTAFIHCDSVFTDSLDINSWNYPNGNGLVFDSCQDVFVSNCKLQTSDDSICLQSSEKSVPCKNIVITNCTMSSRYAGMKIGMLSYGDIEDVNVSNCIMHDLACSGFKIQSSEGGTIRNLLFQNIIMRNVSHPIFITFNHHRVGKNTPEQVPETGGVRNIKFQQILITNEETQKTDLTGGIVISGTPGHLIENINLNDIDYTAVGGGTYSLRLISEIAELTGQRAEPYAFGKSLPSYAAYIRHAKGISIRHLKVEPLKEEKRPAIVLKDVEDFEVQYLKVPDEGIATQ